MHKHHPNYLHEPLQEDLVREHFLHRLAAGRAFLFALCILPVAQYFLVGAHNGEIGQVAGVATEAPSPSPAIFAAVDGNVASPTPMSLLECVRQKDNDQVDLQRFLDGKKKAMLTSYERLSTQYHQQMLDIQGSSVEAQNQKAALQKQIDDLSASYNKELAAVNTAVSNQAQEITNRSCPAE